MGLAEKALRGTPAASVVIDVPGTDAAPAAVQELTHRGVSTTVDGVFCAESHAEVAEAYTRGLERRVLERLPFDRVVSIAWLPLASLDRSANARLSEDSPLRDSVAVAAAQAIYLEVNRRFSGPRWRRLASRRARPQNAGFRELPMSHPGHSTRSHVERLALPGSVLALSPQAIETSRHNERLLPCEPDETEVAWILREAAAAGAPLRIVARELRRSMHERSGLAHRAVLAALAAIGR